MQPLRSADSPVLARQEVLHPIESSLDSTKQHTAKHSPTSTHNTTIHDWRSSHALCFPPFTEGDRQFSLVSLKPAWEYPGGVPELLSDEFFSNIIAHLGQNPNGPNVHHREMRTGGSNSSMTSRELARLKDRTAWWSSLVIHSVCSAAQDRIARLGLRKRNSTPAVYKMDMIPWNHKTKQPEVGGRASGSIPWRSLGRDAAWRRQVTVSVISTEYNTHFATLAIFGPQRIIILYDSSPGSYMNASLSQASIRTLTGILADRKNWPTLLQDRLDWELGCGLVKAEDNEGWTRAPTSKVCVAPTLG